MASAAAAELLHEIHATLDTMRDDEGAGGREGPVPALQPSPPTGSPFERVAPRRRPHPPTTPHPGADDDGAGTPLETLIASLQEEVMRPSPEAPTHAGSRKAIASLLYSSHAPPDCAQFLAATDVLGDKEVGKARKQAFRVLMGHLVAYPSDAKTHMDKLIATCITS